MSMSLTLLFLSSNLIISHSDPILLVPTYLPLWGHSSLYVNNQPRHFILKPSAPSRRSEAGLGFLRASLTVLVLVWNAPVILAPDQLLIRARFALLLIFDSKVVFLCAILSMWPTLVSSEKMELQLRNLPLQTGQVWWGRFLD